jgi:hypothetical protein
MWGVFRKAIERWRLFKEIESGHRFQTRYHSHRRRRERGEGWKYGRIFNLVGGPALIVAGFAFLPLARYLDWAGARLGKLGGWIKDRWSGLPAVVRILAPLVCAAALGYGAYYLLFGS